MKRLKTLERRKEESFWRIYSKIEEVDLIIDFDYGLSKIISGIKNVQKMVLDSFLSTKINKKQKKLEKISKS